MKRIYNKLVRDFIPDLIKEQGKECNYIELDDDEEFIKALKAKLVEEAVEASSANTREEVINELNDIQLVMFTLMQMFDISKEELGNKLTDKIMEKGAFIRRIFLIDVEEDDGNA